MAKKHRKGKKVYDPKDKRMETPAQMKREGEMPPHSDGSTAKLKKAGMKPVKSKDARPTMGSKASGMHSGMMNETQSERFKTFHGHAASMAK